MILPKKNNILFGVDATFSTPVFLRPIEFGADIVMHSTTKSIGGHSDLVGGILVTNNSSIAEKLHFIQKSTGAVPSPFDCWLLLRSVKTLSMRYQKASDSAIKIANWLSNNFNFKIACEIFADRNYEDDGNLVSRKKHNALITNPDEAKKHVLSMVKNQSLNCHSGKQIPCEIDSVCIHGDNMSSLATAQSIKDNLISCLLYTSDAADE